MRTEKSFNCQPDWPAASWLPRERGRDARRQRNHTLQGVRGDKTYYQRDQILWLSHHPGGNKGSISVPTPPSVFSPLSKYSFQQPSSISSIPRPKRWRDCDCNCPCQPPHHHHHPLPLPLDALCTNTHSVEHSQLGPQTPPASQKKSRLGLAVLTPPSEPNPPSLGHHSAPSSTPHPSVNRLAMTWQPQPEGLQTVLDMLRDSSSPDSTVQKAVAKVCCIHHHPSPPGQQADTVVCALAPRVSVRRRVVSRLSTQ